MYIQIKGSKKDKYIYIIRSFRKEGGKTSSVIHKKLGKYTDLLEKFNSEEEMLNWANEEAKKETESFVNEQSKLQILFDPSSLIEIDKERTFNCGYLIIQKILSSLYLPEICRKITKKYKFEYKIESILSDLIYARILYPSSKLSSYDYAKKLLEKPRYSEQDLYRSLSVLAKESIFMQGELFKNSNFCVKRNKDILYYDCTNFFFEIEQEDDFRKYGKCKENRPNPIVTMGLFMDGSGLPLAFDLFPGNKNEQQTLKDLEKKIFTEFDHSDFIFCSDAGLASKANKNFNSRKGRHYVITQSLKKLNKEDREIALSTTNYRKIGSDEFINLADLDENNEKVFESIYYKEIPSKNKANEVIIVTYSPKYKEYQRNIRNNQLERAYKMIDNGKIKRRKRNPNDPGRFVVETSLTQNGEVCSNKEYSINNDLILHEEIFDGFYAVSTDLNDDVSKIIEINKGRREIEESFRIMKTEFKSRPIYVRREDSIRAHFLTCFIALLAERILEKKLGCTYTTSKIIKTLREMKLTLLNQDQGYIPIYKRSEITDEMHSYVGFRTDYEIISKQKIRNIISLSKTK